jgi:hypothetical protein
VALQPLEAAALDVSSGWGAGWERGALVDGGGRLAALGFGIVRVYHPLSATRCSCKAGEACGRNTGKHPIGDDWQRHAEHDPERVRTMLANPGIRSYGIIPPPDVFEWDVDKDAPELLRRLAAEHGPLPPTRVHRSGQGKHVFYRWPESVPRSSANVFGLTTRWAPGGMVVGPGSVHAKTGRLYAVEDDRPIATFPETWAHAASTWSDAMHARQDAAAPGDADWVVSVDHRHDFLKRAAARLRGMGLRDDGLREALRWLNANRCADGGKPADELDDLAAYFDSKADDGPGVFLRLGSNPAAGERLPYRTAREVAGTTDLETTWVVFGYVARQAITELDGKVKESGKTTWIAHGVKAILRGAPFLDATTRPTRVIWMTEQQPGPFREVLAEAGLDDAGDELLVLFRGALAGRTWPETVAQVTADALERGYGLLVVDTIGKFVSLKDENSAAEWARAMDPLNAAAHAGLAVVVARHDRKSGGDVGESGRGSSQMSGDVDIILRLGRPEGRHPQTMRVLEALSRYRVTPERIVIELTDDGYIRHGSEDAVALTACVDAIVRELSPLGSDVRAQTEAELVASTEHPRRTVGRALDRLLVKGTVARTGAGRRGDPYRYALTATAAQTSNPNREGLRTNGAEHGAASDDAFARYLDESSGGMWQRLDEAKA